MVSNRFLTCVWRVGGEKAWGVKLVLLGKQMLLALVVFITVAFLKMDENTLLS